MEVKKIGIVGAGAMGNGIAQLAAQIGCDVVMRDIEMRFVEGGIKKIEGFLSRSVEKGKMDSKEKDTIIERIRGTTDMDDLNEVDFVVEAVLEDMDLKKRVFKQLDELCRPDVILATNTSSMSITEIGASTKRPDKVCGMHFFNPVPLMRLVEIIRGYSTTDETIQTTTELAQKMAAQIAKGASELVLSTGNNPEIEIDKVTTPGVITITGLNEMENSGFSSSLIEGMLAAFNKVNDPKISINCFSSSSEIVALIRSP